MPANLTSLREPASSLDWLEEYQRDGDDGCCGCKPWDGDFPWGSSWGSSWGAEIQWHEGHNKHTSEIGGEAGTVENLGIRIMALLFLIAMWSYGITLKILPSAISSDILDPVGWGNCQGGEKQQRRLGNLSWEVLQGKMVLHLFPTRSSNSWADGSARSLYVLGIHTWAEEIIILIQKLFITSWSPVANNKKEGQFYNKEYPPFLIKLLILKHMHNFGCI